MDRSSNELHDVPHPAHSVLSDALSVRVLALSEALRESRSTSNANSDVTNASGTRGVPSITVGPKSVIGTASQEALAIKRWQRLLYKSEPVEEVRFQSVEEFPDQSQQGAKYDWLPVTLHLPYLIVLFAFSFSFGVAVLGITIYSRVHTGLGSDNGSSVTFFGWRFAPTVVAVVYGVLVGTLLQDVRRTEVFARLSTARPASASSTLLFPLRAWWNDIFDGLSKSKNNGSRSWTLVLASAINVLSLLVISPLSAAFLAPESVEIARETTFTRLGIESLHEVRTDNADALMFRTISGGLLNASTSAWIKNSHLISPFWPDYLQSSPLTSSFALPSQKWIGETTIYRALLNCSTTSVVNVSNTTAYQIIPELAKDDTNVDWPAIGLQFESSDGCTVNVFALDPDQFPQSIWGRGGGWWLKNVAKLQDQLFLDADIIMSNSSGTCGNRAFIFATTGWNSSNIAHTTGAVCTTQYLEADVPVTVLVNQNGTAITFDVKEFGHEQRAMEASRADNITGHIEDGFFAVEWSRKFQSTDVAQNLPVYLGPMRAMAAGPMYEYHTQKIVGDSHLLDQALELYQQWFGQMFISSIESSISPISGTSFQAQIVGDETTRIVAVFAIGLVISILLLLSSLSILLVMLLSRTHRRPLNLNYEPANIAVMASLVAESTDIQHLFGGLDRQSADVVKSRLSDRQFNLKNGTITAEPLAMDDRPLPAGPKKRFRFPVFLRRASLFGEKKISTKPRKVNPTPIVFRIWMGPLLVVVMLGILAALVTLYELSITKGLSSHFLTYELNFTIADKASKFAPYSIAPVVIAVALKLWYGAIDETLRRHQVFYEMTRQSISVRKSLLTEYANTPLFLTSIKAVPNRHWILFLVGLGATAAEIFTIGMSALWNRRVVTVSHSVNISQQLELRAVPGIYDLHWEQTSYGTYIDSWLYSATIELSQKAATPPWSSDIWSFIPTDFAASVDALSTTDASTAKMKYEIDTDTTAIRARLECEGVKEISDVSHWVTKLDLYNQTVDPKTNKTQWDDTSRPPDLEIAYQLHPVIDHPDTKFGGVPILSTGNIPICCANVTNGIPGDSAIGYWSNNLIEGDSETPVSEYNFFATWIVGKPLEDIYNDSSTDSNQPDDVWLDRHWLWTEVPRGQAISCRPIIEQANATVRVDSATGTVLNYSINSVPYTATSAWSDRAVARSEWYGNITVSYGLLFWNALLEASAVAGAVAADAQPTQMPQNDNDHSFNFRDRGLNVDFMTYAMLGLVDNDKYALLDLSTMIQKADRVFSVFFKHYASTSVNFTDGGRVYQPIGLRLPSSLSDPFTSGIGYINADAVDAPRTRTVQIHVPHEMLIISPVAEFLCIGVLVFLLATVVVVYVFHRHTFKVLPRDPDTLANIIAFVYSSSKLLEWADLRRQRGDWSVKDVGEGYDSRIDVFADKTGTERWGIEIEKAGRGNARSLPLLITSNEEKDCEPVRIIEQSAEQVSTSLAAHDEGASGATTDGFLMIVGTQTESPIAMTAHEQNTGISPIDPNIIDWTPTLGDGSRRRSTSISELSHDSDEDNIRRQALRS